MTDEDSVQFSITYALDKDEFFRRTCPNCGRDFKTKANPSDLASILQPVFRKIENEIGEISISTEDHDTNPQYLMCPYCGHRAESGEMITEIFLDYLRRFIIRENVLPKINHMFSDFSDDLNSNSGSNSFFQLEITADFENMLPTRPISGPEPPDMTKIEMLCCGQMIKVYDGWYEIEKCPFCESDVQII